MSELYEIQANNVRLKGLESRFEGLTADHEALSQQMRDTINLAERGRLNRQLLEIDKDLVQVAQAIDQLRERNNELTKTASVKLPEQLHSMASKLQALLDILIPYEFVITVNRETAYRGVCPPDWLRSMPVTLKGTLAELEDMQPDEMGYAAILKFVAYLIADAQVPALLSKQLNQWAEEQSQDFSQLLQWVRQQTLQTGQTAAITSDRRTDSYLMVVIEQSNIADQQKKSCYFVKAWFILDRQDYQPKSGAGYYPLTIPGKLEDAEKAFTCDEIRALLRAFLDESSRECQRQNRSLRNLTIELFLPSDLLNHAVDGWIIDEDDEFSVQEPIGFHHCIHLRSSDRLRPEYLLRRRGLWQAKWDSVQRLAQQLADSTFVAGDGVHYKKLFQALDQSDMVGLKIAQGPLSIGKESAFAVLQATATPLALWLRQPLAAVSYDVELNAVLGCCVHAIPEGVKQQRKEAFSEDLEAHIGHHLALLWEDVDRLPPDLNYQVA
ncbi:MAG: hypothetical protein KME27_17215 [Lyngbya sp. HA4199-MV5]|nr:hypothetical protein [Lyngbya sp. HA4199-MV5]